MTIQENVSLKPYNTFRLEAKARRLAIVHSEMELKAILSENKDDYFILGGGSNMLLTQDLSKLVLKNEIKGIELLEESKTSTIVEIGAGENWHEFVLWAIAQKLGGVENLSLIPGTVGAAPIQNIGAYGVELKDVFVSLDAIHLPTGEKHQFNADNCRFAYRESIFKKEVKGQYCITKVRLKLQKAPHSINSQYGAIQQELDKKGISSPSIQDISQAVITIRQSKLPDPAEIGNSGSFFKNPEIGENAFNQLLEQRADLVYYALASGKYKIPAGWLIDQAGWKGHRQGDAGCHKKQALVLVNYGDAQGNEILELAHRIQEDVFQKFGILLSPEVNVI